MTYLEKFSTRAQTCWCAGFRVFSQAAHVQKSRAAQGVFDPRVPAYRKDLLRTHTQTAVLNESSRRRIFSWSIFIFSTVPGWCVCSFVACYVSLSVHAKFRYWSPWKRSEYALGNQENCTWQNMACLKLVATALNSGSKLYVYVHGKHDVPRVFRRMTGHYVFMDAHVRVFTGVSHRKERFPLYICKERFALYTRKGTMYSLMHMCVCSLEYRIAKNILDSI